MLHKILSCQGEMLQSLRLGSKLISTSVLDNWMVCFPGDVEENSSDDDDDYSLSDQEGSDSAGDAVSPAKLKPYRVFSHDVKIGRASCRERV